jgi:hypothetical protein
MKVFVFLSALTCSICFITSCTKTTNVKTTVYDTVKSTVYDTVVLKTPKNPIFGTWAGSYFVNGASAADSFMYIFYIRTDNTMLAIGSGTNGTAGYSSGPWTLKGTVFSATMSSLNGTTPENVQSITAAYDSTNGILSNGVFSDISGTNTESGTFTLRRIE